MKRDPDLEREILLAIEAYDGESRPGYADLSHFNAPRIQISYQVRLLDEARLWLERLSMITVSPGRRVGSRTCAA